MRENALRLLVEKVHESNLDALLVLKQANVQYITGFTGDYGFAVVSPQKSIFFTNSLNLENAQSSVKKPFAIVEIKDNFIKTFSDLGVSFWGNRVGYEAETLTCSTYTKLKDSLKDVELCATTGMVEELRIVKSASEMKAIIRAQRITESVFNEVLEFVHEGVEERDIACEIDYRIRKKGGERSAFATIVASGPNTSRPHTIPSKRKLKTGDIVLFDMGTVINGYVSDMTRTVVLGEANSEVKKKYAVVLAAQQAAINGITSGMKCSEADLLARNIIQTAGYGDQFIHSLGHGVGLEVHELPSLTKQSQDILKENMVVTVEPGIYVPAWGGIRIEDMVVITDGKCKNLTQTPKTLIEI